LTGGVDSLETRGGGADRGKKLPKFCSTRGSGGGEKRKSEGKRVFKKNAQPSAGPGSPSHGRESRKKKSAVGGEKKKDHKRYESCEKRTKRPKPLTKREKGAPRGKKKRAAANLCQTKA